MHIASLKEQLREYRILLNNEREENSSMTKHYMGIRPATAENQTTSPQQVPIPRNLHSIAGRIQRAEQAEADPALMARRKREYDERIASLIRPETEVQKEG